MMAETFLCIFIESAPGSKRPGVTLNANISGKHFWIRTRLGTGHNNWYARQTSQKRKFLSCERPREVVKNPAQK